MTKKTVTNIFTAIRKILAKVVRQCPANPAPPKNHEYLFM